MYVGNVILIILNLPRSVSCEHASGPVPHPVPVILLICLVDLLHARGTSTSGSLLGFGVMGLLWFVFRKWTSILLLTPRHDLGPQLRVEFPAYDDASVMAPFPFLKNPITFALMSANALLIIWNVYRGETEKVKTGKKSPLEEWGGES